MGSKLNELKAEAREALVEAMDGDFPSRNRASDMVHETADSMVPVYDAEIFELAEDPEVANHESELGPGRDGAPTLVNVAVGAIYEILCEYLNGQLKSIKEEIEEAQEEEESEDEELSKKFVLEINLDNDAFVGHAQGEELAGILRKIATQLSEGVDEDVHGIRDSNGNSVGFYTIEEK